MCMHFPNTSSIRGIAANNRVVKAFRAFPCSISARASWYTSGVVSVKVPWYLPVPYLGVRADFLAEKPTAWVFSLKFLYGNPLYESFRHAQIN